MIVAPVWRRGPAHQQIEQIIVGKRQQLLKTFELLGIQIREVSAVELLQYQVEFQQSSPTMPPDFIELGHAGSSLARALKQCA